MPAAPTREARPSGDREKDQRGHFQRDRGRILYTAEFRRLAEVTQIVSPGKVGVFHTGSRTPSKSPGWPAEEVLAQQFRLRLHRGIGYLATPHAVRSIADLVRLAADGATGGPG